MMTITHARFKLMVGLIAALGCVLMLAPASAHASDPRAATYIGAYASPWQGTGGANDTIGPLQSTRIFYVTLPVSYTDSAPGPEPACSTYPANVVCVISYKTENTNLQKFIQSIPSSRTVVMVFHHEPENDTFSGPGTNGQNFVADFEDQSTEIRQYSGGASNVKVAMVAEAYQYQPGVKNADNGVGCSFIPPDQYVDFYMVDIYQATPNGKDLPNSPVANQWTTWLNCVTAANNANPHPRKAFGIAEYGLGTNAGDTVREETLAADDGYLKANFTNFYLWEYWYANNQGSGSCTPSNCDWMFTDQPTIAEWQSIEAGN